MYIRENKSQRQIHRETGMSRDTIRKYIREYEDQLVELGKINKGDDMNQVDIIGDIVLQPKYKSGPRTKTILTDEVIDRIKFYLKENEDKRLKGLSKQQKKKVDIHQALLADGFGISYASVVNAINKIERKAREAYIRQEYSPGEAVEFDWGTVKLFTEGGILREYQMAVFTSAYGNYKWARLFPKQDTYCFTEAHGIYFDHINGAYRTVVYDNMKVAVKKFVGPSEKEPTEALLKLSIYYRFHYRFCNAYSGNEKGHVEKSVDVIRRKAFSHKYTFTCLDEANRYLQEVLDGLNLIPQKQYDNKSPLEMFNEEKENLLPEMPMYQAAKIADLRVDKYSTIVVDTCHYSVPDKHVGLMVRCKIYSNKILVFFNEEKIAEHTKSEGLRQWKFSIEHYTSTLMRKPKALINSVVLKQCDDRIKSVYSSYFKGKERDFVRLLSLISDFGIDMIENKISELLDICPNDISFDKIKYLCCRRSDNTYDLNYYREKSHETFEKSMDILKSYDQILLNSRGGKKS